MAGATVQQHPAQNTATTLRPRRVLGLAVGVLLALTLVGMLWLRFSVQDAVQPATGQDTGGITLLPDTDEPGYGAPARPPAPLVPPADPYADRLAGIEQQLLQMQAALNNQRPAAPAAPPAATPVVRKHRPMVEGAHTTPAPPDAPATPTYVVAPGDTIPCMIQTVMNSDTGSAFVAITTSPVYDTAYGTRLLIPQSSKIVGSYNGQDLLYGNQRLPTIGLTLTLPEGKGVVELGEAPVTDQVGASGLVSDVDQHFWRLAGAVFVGGALRGGAMALHAVPPTAGAAGALSAGIAQSGMQVVQQRQARALDTRPTIRVYAGELCHVLVTKSLHLAAFE